MAATAKPARVVSRGYAGQNERCSTPGCNRKASFSLGDPDNYAGTRKPYCAQCDQAEIKKRVAAAAAAPAPPAAAD